MAFNWCKDIYRKTEIRLGIKILQNQIQFQTLTGITLWVECLSGHIHTHSVPGSSPTNVCMQVHG